MEDQIERFSSNQVIVHFIIAFAIMILYITGIPRLYPEHLGWILDIIGVSKALFIHRLASIGLLSVSIYYLIYSLLYWKLVEKKFFNKIRFPTSKDIFDFVNDNLSILGLKHTRIDYDKYSWLEKGLIWSVIIVNVLIMGITGFILSVPWLFASNLTTSHFSTINLIHGSFAILSLCVVLPHFYKVHLTPFKFPMDYSMVTGLISKEVAEEDYPYWYRDISGEKHD
ncbi:MAG: cytochrome b/b6 domain-containing protein [Methanosarcinales archaeon]|nr:cytochrome b/b6 domain-containing protein [Methanosarcinales archaeon]